MTKVSDPPKVISMVGIKTILRPVCVETDLPYLLAGVNDETINQFLKIRSPMTEIQEREYLEKIGKDPNNIVYAIEDKATGQFIGVMGLHRIDWVARQATTGSMIVNKEYWGKGFGHDAKMLLLDYAFNRLNLHRINSSVIAFNKRSARCLLKCGYVEEGTRKQYHFRHGKYHDQILFGLLKPQFLPVWKRYSKELKTALIERENQTE